MNRKHKKVLKYRGNRTQGYGCHKKHRGKGSKGGQGYAGSTKHKRIYIRKYEPEHFLKKGFVPMRTKHKLFRKSINVDELADFASEGENINLSDAGITKLLGRGTIEFAVTVIVDQASKLAIDKVEKAGGKVKTSTATTDNKKETKKSETVDEKSETDDEEFEDVE